MVGDLTEVEAERIVAEAVERIGGSRFVVGSPRHPFSLRSTRDEEVDGHVVTINFSEISSPAVASVAGWVFEVQDEGLLLLDKPRPPRPPSA